MLEIKEAVEARWIQHIPQDLNVEVTRFPEAKLIRLLIGTAKIQCRYSGESIIQNINFSDTRQQENINITSRTLKDLLDELGSLENIQKYIKKTNANNFSLFNDLYLEYCLFFKSHNSGNGVSAFLHCYRMIEYCSYTFPLMHASLSRSYTGSYDQLNNYFKRGNGANGFGGELKFFNSFISDIFDDSLLNATADIVVECENIEKNPEIYSALKSVLSREDISSNWQFDDGRETLSVEYKHILSTIINIRNRFFHFAVGGQKNISSAETHNPDEFFNQLNTLFINWLSMIYFEILRYRIDFVVGR